MPSKAKLKTLGTTLEARGIRTMGSVLEEKGIKPARASRNGSKTLQEKRKANGRTLALDGAAWRRLRRSVLMEQPLCPECRDQGLLVPATEVDHDDDDPTNNERSNLVGLCKAHHSLKTIARLHGRSTYGCDIYGMPLDPLHPWNLEKSPATDGDQPTCSPRATAKGTK